MPDLLDTAIEEARAEQAGVERELAELARRSELLAVRVAALEEAALIRPRRDEAQRAGRQESAQRGRQPGAISQTWRSILSVMAAEYRDGADEGEILEIAKLKGLSNIRIKDVRDRMRSYEQYDYVEQCLNGWKVSIRASERFVSDELGSHEDEEMMANETTLGDP